MFEGKRIKLADVAHLKGGYAFKSSQYTKSGRFVLRTVNVCDDASITKIGATFISEEEAIKFERFALKEHDTLFVMVAATLGKIGYVRARDLPALLNQNMWVIRAKNDLIDPIYLHYLFRELSTIPLAWVGGSARSFLRRDDVRNLEFVLPYRLIQEGIAEILKALDDKIELNRRMNETLESMARAIFKDWFVDSGPTRAKAEGHEPYLAPELWDLFPDSIDDQEKPVGWEVRKLEDILKLNYGKSLPARKRTPGNVAVYGSGGIAGTHDVALIEGPAVIVGRKGTVGSLYWEDDPVFPIDTVFYVVPRIGSVLFAYHLLASLPLRDMNTDAAVPGLNRNNAYRLEFPLPSPELISAFEYISGALWKRRAKNLAETKTLTQTRDLLLLAKLMSGEIRLGEAEKAGEAVT